MNVQNEPLHDMAGVVKRGLPPEWRWTLYDFQQGQSLFFKGTHSMLWRGLGMNLNLRKSISSESARPL